MVVEVASAETRAQRKVGEEWADAVPTVFGPAPRPASDAVAALPGVAGGPGLARPRRTLIARRPGSRLPRGTEAPSLAPAFDEVRASPLVMGHIASLRLMASRPELAHENVRLLEFDEIAERWQRVTRKEERLRVKPEMLQSINPAFQLLARRRFDAVDSQD